MFKFLAKLVNWESVRGGDQSTAKRFADIQSREGVLAKEREADALRLRQEDLRRQRDGSEPAKGAEETDPHSELRM
ncbi:MAG: hypothetical protein A2568_02745 [Candidatus Yanofskybacteria bacterium RIFOXYD1_FULL_44_17]|uniref:Uncharacterized protein n=1 Tax=Candidatus Yanofskybacteria bacterium GW2011_GWE2_40_11 TaxID=1619033 RepID=A0A0G0QKG1_9BACT|nr:MAG: hypothetical protein UT69_C0021G0006 [Candidatus Yanofskybacteria bacterium GW2011_GWE1_40_10]KKR40914.1 MAG: hypothetical protein UT75_C0003G0044 [Candidatus Yanofskybacteria bacterium GW2011_GWE2_40_11]KKT14464.1 MAG: hypothetical protein UV97_C0022G0002 [Candidatus Yanofskybacteria bacterium GW2011_GWF2_43_596]OGN35390.1 MAG: hypothetical protein A2207_00145 [Candidatus Yanofskybacteria bacterium RIFOXYA1_FULL_44_17]OGN36521.1 MAG: hypothetical protein A2241_02160 [Candidatus Yanofsk